MATDLKIKADSNDIFLVPTMGGSAGSQHDLYLKTLIPIALRKAITHLEDPEDCHPKPGKEVGYIWVETVGVEG